MILANQDTNRQLKDEITAKINQLKAEIQSRFQSAKVELSSFVTGLCSELKAIRHLAITGFLSWVVGINTGLIWHDERKKERFTDEKLIDAIAILRDGAKLQVAVTFIQENLERYWQIKVSHITIRRDLHEMEVMGLFTREQGQMVCGIKGTPRYLENICIEKILAYGNLLECRLTQEGWNFRQFIPNEYSFETHPEAKLFPSHNNSTLYNLATKVFGLPWRRVDPMLGEDAPDQVEAFAEVKWLPAPEEPPSRPWQEIVEENKQRFMNAIDWASRTFYRHLGQRKERKQRDPNIEFKQPSVEDSEWMSLSHKELLPDVQLDRPAVKEPVNPEEPVENSLTHESYPTPEPTLEQVIENHNQILDYHRQQYKHRPWLIRRMEERFKEVQKRIAKQAAGGFDVEVALGF